MIRSNYWGQLSAHEPNREKRARHSHIVHCFDYLRQAIECAADMTIEWADLSDPHDPKINGWGITHQQCRDHVGF